MKLVKLVIATGAVALTSCSNAPKARQAERERLANSTGLYCDFVNGDEFKDADIALNISMAKRCDPAKPFSMTGYKNASEIHGIVFCCSTVRHEAPARPARAAKETAEEKSEKAANDGDGGGH